MRGNHDNHSYHDDHAYQPNSSAALAEAKLPDLNNNGVWLERGSARLRVCGVGDLWTDRQDLDSALGDATDRDAVLLLSHNPDFAETIRDPRVGLVVERPHSRRPDRLTRHGRSDRPVALRPKIPLRPCSSALVPGVHHPRRGHHHASGPVPLPARGRLDHTDLEEHFTASQKRLTERGMKRHAGPEQGRGIA